MSIPNYIYCFLIFFVFTTIFAAKTTVEFSTLSTTTEKNDNEYTSDNVFSNVTNYSTTSIAANTTTEYSTLSTTTEKNNNKYTEENVFPNVTNYSTTSKKDQNIIETTTKKSECKDKNFKNGITCDSLKLLCNNTEYKKIMEEKCPMTCGICMN
uniref:ShKT domain-containing protein n=1 Tax=Strongyloides stercoralis TaxID=6248 RepID=A0A0K0EIL8_STRER